MHSPASVCLSAVWLVYSEINTGFWKQLLLLSSMVTHVLDKCLSRLKTRHKRVKRNMFFKFFNREDNISHSFPGGLQLTTLSTIKESRLWTRKENGLNALNSYSFSGLNKPSASAHYHSLPIAGHAKWHQGCFRRPEFPSSICQCISRPTDSHNR